MCTQLCPTLWDPADCSPPGSFVHGIFHGIPVELFQILKDDAVKVLHSLCQQIWKTQQWPQDWELKKGRQKEEEIGGREKSERSSSALGRVINNGFVWEGELTVHLLGMPVEESGQETGQPPKDRGPTTATAGALTHSPSHLVLALPFPLFLFPSFRPML